MKKRLTILLFSAILSMSMTIPVLAAEGVGQEEKHYTVVRMKIDVRYIVTIPEGIDVPFNQIDTDFDIKVTDAVLHPQGKITVSNTDAAGSMTNASGFGSKLAYTIQDDQGQDFTSIEFTGNGSKPCRVHIAQKDWNKAAAGDYSGTTTFTVAYNSGSGGAAS